MPVLCVCERQTGLPLVLFIQKRESLSPTKEVTLSFFFNTSKKKEKKSGVM